MIYNIKFDNFYKDMIKKIKEKQEELGDSWKFAKIPKLEYRIIEHYKKWKNCSDKHDKRREYDDLIDIANECLLCAIRIKEEYKDLFVK